MAALIPENLAVYVVDSLSSNICVVDRAGTILAVNRAWIEFSANNSGGGVEDYLGASYLNVCENSSGSAAREAAAFSKGLRDVLDGRADQFQIEYPCHSPSELRWFLARVTPLSKRGATGSAERNCAVVSHMNVTDRKLLELRYAKLASTDPLTDLPNRRFFEDFARIEVDRLRRFGGSMSLMMLDLDNFKFINDRYGHLARDAVLKKFAACCKRIVRERDLIARIGGEEFVVLLFGSDVASAVLLAERLRSRIASLRITTAAGVIRVTSSIGVTLMTAKDRSITAALQRADEALYAAKSGGRNRVEMI
ncbi:MAG: GGDEF domain-containing protein [Microvirga sp.]|nr:GGDEF domain-containing protein [Microvirga sp.]